jgi:hypothetical protein
MPAVFALLVALSGILAVAEPSEQCLASSFSELEACLDRPAAADPATHLEVIITGDLVLGDRQHIQMTDRHNLTVRGDGLVTISETLARNEGQGGNNRYMMSVLGGSALRLHDLRFVDAAPNELDRRCRAGAHPTLPNRWEKGPCDPPVLVGGGVADLRISGVEIRSDKPVLLELRDATGVAIERSRFLDGTVFGVVFARGFHAEDVSLANNEFREIGANAVVVHNATGVEITGNRFVDNHWDRQFLQCGPSGREPCTGGQILVRDHRDQPVSGVVIRGNVVTQTDPTRATATGIEIGNADRADLNGIIIVDNEISRLARQAIQVHFGARPGGHSVVVAFNRLLGNGLVENDGGRGPQITINDNSGVAVFGNATVHASMASVGMAHVPR